MWWEVSQWLLFLYMAAFSNPKLSHCPSRHPREPSIINTCICDKAGTGYRNWLAVLHTLAISGGECRRGPAVSLAEPRPVKTAPAILIITSNCGKHSPRHFSCLSSWPASLPLDWLSLLTCSLGSFGGPSLPWETHWPWKDLLLFRVGVSNSLESMGHFVKA